MVTGGTYKGRKGWRRLRNWVILEGVHEDEGDQVEEIQVNISKKYIKDIIGDQTIPENREQAVFKEFPDTLVALETFVEKLVEVNNLKPNTRMIEIIWNKWHLEYQKAQLKTKRTVRFLRTGLCPSDREISPAGSGPAPPHARRPLREP